MLQTHQSRGRPAAVVPAVPANPPEWLSALLLKRLRRQVHHSVLESRTRAALGWTACCPARPPKPPAHCDCNGVISDEPSGSKTVQGATPPACVGVCMCAFVCVCVCVLACVCPCVWMEMSAGVSRPQLLWPDIRRRCRPTC